MNRCFLLLLPCYLGLEVMRETQLPEVLSKPVSLTLLTLLRNLELRFISLISFMMKFVMYIFFGGKRSFVPFFERFKMIQR